VGTLASFYFAYELMTVPLGIFAMSFSIAAFPSLAGFIGKSDLSGFRKFFSTTVVQILFLIIPISVLMLLLRAQIVRLIPGAGEGKAFTFEHTRLTAQALGFFALSLFSQSLTPLLARAFFALQNTLIPLVAGTAAAGINIVLAVVFSRYDGAASLALAFSIASVVNLLILGILLQQRVQGILDEILFVRVFKIGIASMVMGAVSYLTLYAVAPMVNMQTYWGILIQAASAVLVGGLVYVGAGIVINLPESRHLVQILRDWFSKFTKPVVSAVVDLFTDIQ
jgi:putative peptidoglycan lipid II flippase